MAAKLNESKVNTSACNFNKKFIYAFGSSMQSIAKKKPIKYLCTIERMQISEPTTEKWTWEIINCKNSEAIEREIQCNFIQVNTNEILILSRQGYIYKFDVEKSE